MSAERRALEEVFGEKACCGKTLLEKLSLQRALLQVHLQRKLNPQRAKPHNLHAESNTTFAQIVGR
jgi:hypothetical protein